MKVSLDDQTVHSWFARSPLQWKRFLERFQKGVQWKSDDFEKIEKSLEKADGYYYKCVDRMKRIWDAGRQPLKDLSLEEMKSLTNSAEFFLFVLRVQRDGMQHLFERLIQSNTFVSLLKELHGDLLHLERQDHTTTSFPSQTEAFHAYSQQWEMFSR